MGTGKKRMKLRQLFENRGNSVGVCFGRWNPPHKGHKAAWEIAASFGTFYVGTNKNTEGPNDPLPYEVKLKAMETIWPEIAGHVIPEQSLFTLVSKIFAKHGERTHLKVATDEEWLAASLIKYNGQKGPHGYYKFASIEQVPTPRLSSATALRAAVRAGDRDGFSDAAGVDADTPIRIGKKTVAFFDLVAHYLAKHPEKAKKVKKVAEVTPLPKTSVPVPALPADQRPYQGKWAKVVPNATKGFDVEDFDGTISLRGAPLANANAHAKVADEEYGKIAPTFASSIQVHEHKKGVRAMKYTKKPVNPSAQHAKAKEKLAPIKPGVEKQTDECAGVGTITKQNSTGDVNKGTPYKNLKAFNLVKEGIDMRALAEKAKQLLAQGMSEQQVINQLVKQGVHIRYAQQAVQAAQMNEIAGAFPSPSTREKWAKDAAASNAAEAKRLADIKAKADAERLRVNNAIVDKEQRINYHPMPDNEPVKESSLDTYMAERAAYLAEAGMKKIDKAAKGAMKNAMTLPALNMNSGSMYLNYRMGVALAGAPDFPTKMEADNWIGGDPLLSTYTEEEFEMVKAAAKQVGAGTIQNWSGKRSEEVADVNKVSAVAKIKRNKYGV